MKKKSSASQSSAGRSLDYLMTDGRSKLTGPAPMVRATPTLYSLGPLAVQLGRLASNDLSRTRSERKAGRVLEALGLEILAKQAEERGIEGIDRGLIHTHSKRRLSGKR